MAEIAAVLVQHRARWNEIAAVLVRHGFAASAAHGAGIASVPAVEHIVRRVVTPDEMQKTEGENRIEPAVMTDRTVVAASV